MHTNEQLIRQFAYQIWESEGRPHGQDMRHWEMACILADGHIGPSDPMEPLTGPAATVDVGITKPANKRKKTVSTKNAQPVTTSTESGTAITAAENSITPPPSRVKLAAGVDGEAISPKKRPSTKDKTLKH